MSRGLFHAAINGGHFRAGASAWMRLADARFSATTSNVNIKAIDFFGLPSIPISRALQTSTGTTLRVTIWTLAGGHTVLQRDWGNLDVFVGFRFLNVNSVTNFSLALTVTGPRRRTQVHQRTGTRKPEVDPIR
jgi:hypothetical protein